VRHVLLLLLLHSGSVNLLQQRACHVLQLAQPETRYVAHAW
jgi:hypothetical protein